jgi:hypothetical protein
MNTTMFLFKRLRKAVTPGAGLVFSVALATLSASFLLLATTSCKKKSEVPDSVVINDQRLDGVKIDRVFQGASPEVLKSIDNMETQARYRNYDAALTELDKLANDSSLTDIQKKTVGQITDWVKQKQGAPAGPSQ